MGSTQFVGATAHATGYLVVVDTAPAFFIEKAGAFTKISHCF
jgi:hypothetical protein